MTRPDLACANFFARYRGLVGAAGEFARDDGHAPEDFVLLLLASTDFIPGCLAPALAYASRPAGLGLALRPADAQAVLRGKTLPPDMSFGGGDGAFERCARELDNPPDPGNSWLVVIVDRCVEMYQAGHNERFDRMLERVSARGGDA